MNKKAKVIVTIGPATATERALRQIKGKGVDFVRVNMSHSSLDDLLTLLKLSMKVGLPFILDTEGSQVRTGLVRGGQLAIEENSELEIHGLPVLGDSEKLCLRPASILDQLQVGDLIHIDFDTLALRVTNTSTLSQGFIGATAISEGKVGSNKAVVIDPRVDRRFVLPPLSEKDLEAIEMALQLGVAHIAVSFVRSGEAVDEVRRVTQDRMTIISKIECIDALHHLDEILAKTDAVLLDRGDLSKEIPVERIPFTQKIVMRRAKDHDRPVYVATNLLETMIRERKPTRAEVQDVINTLVDGAAGLTLAAETAVGRYPMECINVVNKLILHAERTLDSLSERERASSDALVGALDSSGYLLDYHVSSALVQPHGGRLVSRMAREPAAVEDLDGANTIRLDARQRLILDQIAVGALSPLEGYLGADDFHSVLDEMRLTDGTVWPVPIVLDVARAVADRLSVGSRVGLTDEGGDLVGVLHLSELYELDQDEMAIKMYGTADERHPGVAATRALLPVLAAGKVDVVQRRDSAFEAYELTPRQLRGLFAERGWARVLGCHSRTVAHWGHELMQLEALERGECDGTLIHLVVEDRTKGEFRPELVVQSYETMAKRFYPKNRVVLATIPTFPRCLGPREAVLAALYHKNFGCSQFLVNGFADADAADDRAEWIEIFERLPELGIVPVALDEVRYSRKRRKYVFGRSAANGDGESDVKVDGAEVKNVIARGARPPRWLMRPQIAQLISDASKRGDQIFES